MGARKKGTSVLGRFTSRWPLATLAIEVLSIVFGVLLALGVNEWRQNRANAELAERARTNLFAEIEANRNHLQIILDQNLAFQRRMTAASSDDDDEVGYQLAWGLQDTAWNVARDTEALQYMPFETVYGFSAVYSFQQTYRNLGLQMSQAQMMGFMNDSGDGQDGQVMTHREIYRRFLPIIELMIENEKSLLAAYENALAHRDSTS